MKTIFRKLIIVTAGALLAGAPARLNASLIVDRGLPSANLNNASGPNRSNVAWAFGIDNDGSWLVGDNFSNTSSNTYYIDTIRLWSVGETTSATLWGGLSSAASFTAISSTYTATAVQYSGGASYQGSSGGYATMTQLDFAVNLTLEAGATFNFFLDGARSSSPFIPFVHSSNAALSGSPQDGADNTMLYGLLASGTMAAANVGTWTSLGNGWDKASDVNVQVYGQVPDASATVILLGLGFAGFGMLQVRHRRR